MTAKIKETCLACDGIGSWKMNGIGPSFPCEACDSTGFRKYGVTATKIKAMMVPGSTKNNIRGLAEKGEV